MKDQELEDRIDLWQSGALGDVTITVATGLTQAELDAWRNGGTLPDRPLTVMTNSQ